jgi:hypothetical protein
VNQYLHFEKKKNGDGDGEKRASSFSCKGGFSVGGFYLPKHFIE